MPSHQSVQHNTTEVVSADPVDNSVYQNNPRVYVARSGIHGHGLFARTDIAKGQFIGSYAGRETAIDGMHVLWLYDDEADQWEGIDGDNEMRFLNHSDKPNADFWNTDLYALQEIRADEEITFDYHWEPEP
jgi:SET domain-containing protein